MSLIRNIVVFLIILLLLFFGIKQQMDVNSLKNEINQLEKTLAEITYENSKKEYEVNKSPEEFLQGQIDKAYKDPDAQHFVSDFNG